VQIFEYKESDSIRDITIILHKAYSKLAKMGLQYVATYQDDEITMRRLTKGKGFVGIENNRIVGTISLYPPGPESSFPLYQRVYHFGQFAIDPECQGRGLGKQLYLKVEEYCRSLGQTILALDTAEPALHLITMYQKWGYTIVDKTNWDMTNYSSVIMTKKI
jgi:GNAT superfamily N-acetyltransferase